MFAPRRSLLTVVLSAVAVGAGLPASPAPGRAVDTLTKPGRLATLFHNVRVRTQKNQEVRFYDDLVKGKIVMINFMFTSCTTLCPRSTENLVKVQQALGGHAGRDVFLISISVDPEHDTPAVLAQYAQRFHTTAGWTFVTGQRDDIDLIRRNLEAYDRDDNTQHTGMLIYGDDARGSWAGMPVMVSPTAIARSVLRFVDLRASSDSEK
jgi:protein SCO1/2